MKKILCIVGCVVSVSWSALAFEQDQVKIHGFVSQGYLRSDQYNYMPVDDMKKGTVEFNEFGFNVTSNLSSRLRVGIQLLARDLGNTGNDEVTIDWAFGDYRYRNWLGARFGQFTRAFGLYNQSRDIDSVRNGVFLPLSVYHEANRVSQKSMKGIALYGALPGAFEYQIQYGTLDAGFQAKVANDAYVLHMQWNAPVDGLILVGTFDNFSWSSTSTVDAVDVTSTFELEKWLAGIEYTRGNLTCAAEYTERTINGPGFDRTAVGYYGLLTYRLTDWVELGTVYATTYMNKDDKEGDSYASQGLPRALAWSKDLSLTARFDINEYWIAKLEGHWINGLGGLSDYGDDPSEDGVMVAAKVTFSF